MNSHQEMITTLSKRDANVPFPVLLHRMLNEVETMKDLRTIVSWQEHGRAFKIHDKKRFNNVIMKTWFSRIKYASWVRQVNSFGFKRIQEDGPDQGAFYHEMFIRDMPELAKDIEKTQRKRGAPEPPRQSPSLMPSVVSDDNVSGLRSMPSTKAAPAMEQQSLGHLMNAGRGCSQITNIGSMNWNGATQVPFQQQQQASFAAQQMFGSNWHPVEDHVFVPPQPPAMISPQTSCGPAPFAFGDLGDLEPVPLNEWEPINVIPAGTADFVAFPTTVSSCEGIFGNSSIGNLESLEELQPFGAFSTDPGCGFSVATFEF